MQWLFNLALPEPEHFNQSLFLELRVRPDRAALAAAVLAIVEHHDALRLRVNMRASEPHCELVALASLAEALHTVDLSQFPPAQHSALLEQHAIRYQRSLDPAAGRVFQAVYFDLGPDSPGRLLFLGHHLVVDGVSWRILQQDLLSAYQQAVAGRPIVLPRKTTSLTAWSRHLEQWAVGPEAAEAATEWRSQLEGVSKSSREIPEPLQSHNSAVQSASLLQAELPPEFTARLVRFGRRLPAMLLAALARAWQSTTGSGELLLDIESHGRESSRLRAPETC